MPHVQMIARAIAVAIVDTAVVTHAAETAKAQVMPLEAEDAVLAKTFAGDALVVAREIVAEVALQHPQDDYCYSLGSAELIVLPNLSNTNSHG